MSPTEPLVEILRGGTVESSHTGTIAVMDDSGKPVFAWGDISRAVYPRSAIKVIQALPLVESGAADAAGYDDHDLALACASHSGEPVHTTRVAAILARLELPLEALECGCHWPSRADAAYALAAAGEKPTALHNNCSGKHAAFLSLAKRLGYDPRGYVGAEHPVQRDVRQAVAEMVGVPLSADACGTDGCSIPTYALPLDRLATAFARLGTGRGLPPERAAAAKRLREACAAAPMMVAGTGRFCTGVMALLGTRAFVKTGAEGVFCAMFPEQGLGVALKIDDGASRASEIAMAALIERFVPLSNAERVALNAFVEPEVKNWNGIVTGVNRPGAGLRKALGA